jgi:hypothetical protein
MRLNFRSPGSLLEVLVLSWVAAGCSSSAGPAQGSRGGEGGESAAGSGGSGGPGGSVAGGSGGKGGSGGSTSVMRDAGDQPMPDAESSPPPDAEGDPMADGSMGTEVDGGALADSSTPMSTDGGPAPSYNGEIPIYYGPEVGPIVKMDCPGDPTEGWKEYAESFHVEHPYTIPTNTRFSIVGGVYNFWVFPNDAPHSPTAQGRNPRTEANYGGLHDKTPGTSGSDGNGHFTSGMRLYSADMLVEKNAVGSAIMQIHTTATGGGPIGLRIQSNSDMVNNGSLTVVTGSSVPGGLIDKWFNFKASLNVATMEVNIYINNCLKKTYTGTKGDGHFYFKNGVYFCKTSQKGCFSHYKNLHLYTK